MTDFRLNICGALLLLFAFSVISASDVTEEDVKKFAIANNYLAKTLYPRLIDGNTDNVVFCPASLMTGLGIMLYGARGNTSEELTSVLGYDAAGLPKDKVPPTFDNLFTKVLPENNPTQVNYTLYCADRILFSKEIEVDPSYKEDVDKFYKASVINFDFEKSSKEIMEEVNSFVQKKTYGEVNTIDEIISPNCSAALIDVVYFNGKWEKAFSPKNTELQYFFNSGQNSRKAKVAFMRQTNVFYYSETSEFQALELPYIGENVGLLVLLPSRRDGLSLLENTLSLDQIPNILPQLRPTKVKISLPKFRIQYHRDFSRDFEALGAESVYTGPADFSGITSSEDLVVSETIHKAVIAVDEGNTQEPGGCVFDERKGPTVDFKANHPFMFAVVDRRNSLLFYLGRINNV